MSSGAHDVVVVGAGLGGLACAARLARGGASVLVVEQQDRPGGLAGSFHRSGFDFELSLHLVDAVGPGDPNRWVLEELGLAERLALCRPAALRREIWPEHDVVMPVGIERWCEVMSALFPAERSGLRAFTELARDSHRDLLVARDGELDPVAAAALGAAARRSAGELARGLLGDRRLIAMLDLFARGWLGLRLDAAAASAFLAPWYSYQAFGGYYPRGGSEALVRGLVASIRRSGGVVICGSAARRIVVERGRVRGVELEAGRWEPARAVVCNASAPKLAGELLDPAVLGPRERRRLTRLTPSVSCVKVWLGLGCARGQPSPGDYDVYLCPTYGDDWGELDPRARRLSVVSPASLGPGHVPAGRDMVSATMLVSFEAWQRARVERTGLADELAEGIVARVQQALGPGIGDATVVRSVATPDTFQRFTGQPGGAIYGGYARAGELQGWRLPAATPIAGLWLVGAWSHLGAGVSSTLIGGCQVARVLLRAGGRRRGGGR